MQKSDSYHPANYNSSLPISTNLLHRGRQVIETEMRALVQLSETLDSRFSHAAETILATKGRVVVTGMGKSGHIGRKIAATLASTGTPSIYLHPAEAAHGDLGMLMPNDTLLMFSYSGETRELRPVLDYAKHLKCAIIGVSSQEKSRVMRLANVALVLPKAQEACPSNIAPTTSTTLMLALGDALAIAVMSARGINRQSLMLLHPGGNIGVRLSPVGDFMHRQDRLPLVAVNMPMRDVIIEMTTKSLGIAGVVNADGALIGIISDGDLRRHVDALHTSTAQDVMTNNPKTVQEHEYLEDAMAIMSVSKITALFVMAQHDCYKPVGVIQIHDFVRLGLLQSEL